MLRIIRILGNRSAGFIFSMIVALNLALGSLIMNLNPGLYPPFFRFELNYFFNPVKGVHFWLYLLLLTMFLFGANLFFSTLESVIILITKKGGKLSINSAALRRSLAAIFIHLAIFLALLSHLYEGFRGDSKIIQAANLEKSDDSGTYIDPIGRLKINSLTILRYPDGSTKDIIADATIKKNNGTTVNKKISYNSPAMFDFGTREIVIQQGRALPYIIVLKDKNGKELFIQRDKDVKTDGGAIRFFGINEFRNGIKVAQFLWKPETDKEKKLFMVTGQNSRHNSIDLNGRVYKYERSVNAYVLTAQVVYNPAIPLILLALALSLIGIYFMVSITGKQ